MTCTRYWRAYMLTHSRWSLCAKRSQTNNSCSWVLQHDKIAYPLLLATVLCSSLALWVMVPVESQSLNIFEQARRRHSQTPVQNVQGCQSCKFYYASEARQKSRMNWTTNFHITATIHYISLRDKVMHGTSRGRCIGHTLLLCLEPKLGFKALRHKNLQDAAMWFTWSQSG